MSTLTPIESALSSNEGLPFRHIPEHWVLFRSNGFYGSDVGESGGPSREVIAFRMLLARPEADAPFKDLIRRASLPGQLYGLCGVYFTDPPAFRREVVRYSAMEDEIEEQRYGCAVPALVEQLWHPELSVRASILYALGSMGPAARAAVPSIARALEDESFEPRDVASKAIQRIRS